MSVLEKVAWGVIAFGAVATAYRVWELWKERDQ